jgi:hypothetical protein
MTDREFTIVAQRFIACTPKAGGGERRVATIRILRPNRKRSALVEYVVDIGFLGSRIVLSGSDEVEALGHCVLYIENVLLGSLHFFDIELAHGIRFDPEGTTIFGKTQREVRAIHVESGILKE